MSALLLFRPSVGAGPAPTINTGTATMQALHRYTADLGPVERYTATMQALHRYTAATGVTEVTS